MSEPSFRPEARAPRGFSDKRAGDLRVERRILDAVSKVYERYGFEALDTGAFEYADALGKFLPDSDRPNEGVFALQDDDEQWMALRYDLTAPLARFAAENWETLPKPFRRYAFGPVWRNEKPGPGRYRQFIQCDADTVGSARPEADAEMIAMAAAGLEAAGLRRGDYRINFNSRKLLDGVMEMAGAAGAVQKLTVLRAIDKLDRLGWAGVSQLLGPGRKDESGDFTKGAQLGPAGIEVVARFLDGDFVALGGGFAGGNASFDAGYEDLTAIQSALRAMGVDEDQAAITPSIVRGLEYYTGAVFEAELQIPMTDEKGQPVRFGSVGGGGRYDDLVARFTGTPVPATGFSFGVSRLAAALRAAGQLTADVARGPVVIIAFDQDQMPAYFTAAAELRAANIPAEVYLGSSGMRPQMKYADRRMAPAAVIMGGDEIAAGTVTIKDLDLGRALSAGVTDNEAWRAERPGQMTVPRDQMVAAILQIIEASSKGKAP
jgi:histidyl-tRNA synthetase